MWARPRSKSCNRCVLCSYLFHNQVRSRQSKATALLHFPSDQKHSQFEEGRKIKAWSVIFWHLFLSRSCGNGAARWARSRALQRAEAGALDRKADWATRTFGHFLYTRPLPASPTSDQRLTHFGFITCLM